MASAAGQPGRGAGLQQAGNGRAVDQRGQAGSEDDAAELPSIPVKRGAALVERNCLRPSEPVAAAGESDVWRCSRSILRHRR